MMAETPPNNPPANSETSDSAATQPAVENQVASTPAVQPDNSSCGEPSDLSVAQGTENFIETYHAISEWIRFADAKAAVILTVGGALAGFLIPTIHKFIEPADDVTHLFEAWQPACVALFTLYIIFFLTSGIYAFLCINPLRKKGKHPSLDYCKHFHPAAVAIAYRDDDVEKFIEDCDRMKPNSLKREVQAAILLDSHISNIKYGRVRKSLIHFSISVVFGFAYFLLSQF